ncbi:MAG: hypothetical protein HRU24_04020 [Gammaproteobacteria bacterium]|nr:hypothetical protein [Gammaproteobacteria bacterium]
MQIGHSYGAGYTTPTPNRTGVSQNNTERINLVNPTTVRRDQDALKTPIKPQEPQPTRLNNAEVAMVASSNQTIYDKPTGASSLAIQSYQQVVNQPKREEIQRLVGIDIFA